MRQELQPVTRKLEQLRLAAAALGEPHRLRLLLCLLSGTRTVGELVAETSGHQPLVSHHLAVLSRAGLVEATKEGRHRRYRLANPDEPFLRRFLDLLVEVASADPAAFEASFLARASSQGAAAPQPMEDYLL